MARKIGLLSNQCDSLTAYLRVVKANVRRAGEQLNVSFSRRSRYPFEDNLRWKSYCDARALELVVEACLHDLKKAKVMRLSPFQPGDHCIVTTTLRGFPTTEMQCAIYDIEPRPKSEYSYEVFGITKKGELSKRLLGTTVWASKRNSIRICSAPLTSETERILAAWRDRGRMFTEQVVSSGQLDRYVVERNDMGVPSVKRKR
jgi:hypothetical protein